MLDVDGEVFSTWLTGRVMGQRRGHGCIDVLLGRIALEKLSDVVYRVGLVRRNRVIVLHRDWLAPYHPLALALPRIAFGCCSAGPTGLSPAFCNLQRSVGPSMAHLRHFVVAGAS